LRTVEDRLTRACPRPTATAIPLEFSALAPLRNPQPRNT